MKTKLEPNQIYNNLKTLYPTEARYRKQVVWRVQCLICGTETEFPSNLIKTKYKSCGCLKRARLGKETTTHGHTKKRGKSYTYLSWAAMKERCLNPNNNRFKYYGKRGITIDPSWMTFDSFLSDMGERPDGTSLDRIDVNGNYCKENCRWADAFTQARNKQVREKEVCPDADS